MLKEGDQYEPQPSQEEQKVPKEDLLREEEEILQKLRRGEVDYYDEEAIQFRERFKEEIIKRGVLNLIYRDNDLFRRYVPIIAKILTEMGRKVSVQAFQEGTSKEEIQNWLEENKNSIYQENGFITDWTVRMTFDYPVDLKFENRDIGRLDEIIRKSLLRLLLKSEEEVLKNLLAGEEGKGSPYVKDMEENKIIFTSVIKNMLQDPENVPKKVYVFSYRMIDHISVLGKDPLYEELTGKMAEAQNQEDKSRFKKIYTQTSETIANNIVKNWLIEGGIEPSKIVIVTEDFSQYSTVPISERSKLIREVDKPNVWIIADRHQRIPSLYGPFTSAKFFQWPIDSFIHDVINIYSNMFSFSEEEIENALRESLKECLKVE